MFSAEEVEAFWDGLHATEAVEELLELEAADEALQARMRLIAEAGGADLDGEESDAEDGEEGEDAMECEAPR